MTTNQTVETNADVTAYFATIADERQRTDATELAAMMARTSGEPAKMWGPSIVGFGSLHYRYDSGREGNTMRIGFAARKSALAIYGTGQAPGRDELLTRLGKHSTGKGCLYIKRLSDIDAAVLGELIAASLARTADASTV